MPGTDLRGKRVLVTGSSRGIGRGIALMFAERGADVVINYLKDEQAAREAKAGVEARGCRAQIIQADVGRPKDIRSMFEAIRESFGGLDILVHNAALGVFRPIAEIEVFHWNVSLDVNARALLLCAQEAVPLMAAGGSVIAVSSIGSHRYMPHYGAIGVSKAALEALVRYLAVELAPKGIRVNGVSGGFVDTDALRLHPDYQGIMARAPARTPGGRIGTPEDLASVVMFLAGEESRWIYGQTIIADGGLDLG